MMSPTDYTTWKAIAKVSTVNIVIFANKHKKCKVQISNAICFRQRYGTKMKFSKFRKLIIHLHL